MRVDLATAVVVLLASAVSAAPLPAQRDTVAGQGDRRLVVERQLPGDSTTGVTVALVRRVVYWVEVSGPGRLSAVPARRGRPGFIVPIDSGRAGSVQRFELYALEAGEYDLRLSGAPGTTSTIRLYVDAAQTADIAARRDRELSVGVYASAGIHTGYRLDPTGGAQPRGGSDLEACLLAEFAGRFGTCIGMLRQAFPDHGFSVAWLFIEERVRLVSARGLGGKLVSGGVILRLSRAGAAGPRGLTANQAGVGFYLRQRIASEDRRGWSAVVSWMHGRQGGGLETEKLDTDRITVGLVWMP